MAKAIVEKDGPQGLAAFLKQPPYKFVLRYTQLPAYGRDKDHPKLGPNTIDAANQPGKRMQLKDQRRRSASLLEST
jgi:hypothetical protein